MALLPKSSFVSLNHFTKWNTLNSYRLMISRLYEDFSGCSWRKQEYDQLKRITQKGEVNENLCLIPTCCNLLNMTVKWLNSDTEVYTVVLSWKCSETEMRSINIPEFFKFQILVLLCFWYEEFLIRMLWNFYISNALQKCSNPLNIFMFSHYKQKSHIFGMLGDRPL